MKKIFLLISILFFCCITIYSQVLNSKIGGYIQYDKFRKEKIYDNVALGVHFAGGERLEFYYDWIAEYTNFFPRGRSHHPGLNFFVIKNLFLSGGMVIRESDLYADKSLILAPEAGLGYDLYENDHFGIRSRVSYRYFKYNKTNNLRFSAVLFFKAFR